MTSSLPGWHITFISHAKLKRKKLTAIPCAGDGENNEEIDTTTVIWQILTASDSN